MVAFRRDRPADRGGHHVAIPAAPARPGAAMTGIILRIVLPSVIVGTMILAVVIYISDAERAKNERDALDGRIDNINTSREIDNEVDQLTPADRLRELCQRLSACDQ